MIAGRRRVTEKSGFARKTNGLFESLIHNKLSLLST